MGETKENIRAEYLDFWLQSQKFLSSLAQFGIGNFQIEAFLSFALQNWTG